MNTLAAMVLAYLVDSYTSGLNRICIYESYMGKHAVTIKSHQICPNTIKVETS